jgi:hypothetical protein
MATESPAHERHERSQRNLGSFEHPRCGCRNPPNSRVGLLSRALSRLTPGVPLATSGRRSYYNCLAQAHMPVVQPKIFGPLWRCLGQA